jgi:UDP-N-acetylglucosamine pyrophosphorylase
MDSRLAVVIMAAGKGTRMNNPAMAKVMYTIANKPMVEHVVDLGQSLHAARIVVIVGWQKDTVIDHLRQRGKNVVCVEQNPQLGTGHAIMQAEEPLEGFFGDVLVLSGDVPLLTRSTVHTLLSYHREKPAAATILTALLDDPTGYGRILRTSGDGRVTGIVEHKDATEEQRAVREINSGIYLFDKQKLFDGLQHITPNNVQKEYYLTDVFQYFWQNQFPVRAVPASDAIEIQGINTVKQLEDARAVFAARKG